MTWLTLTDAAAILNVDRRTVSRWVDNWIEVRGDIRLRGYRSGDRIIYISDHDLAAFRVKHEEYLKRFE